MSNSRTYLGLDFSTQQLKAVLVNDDLSVNDVFSINFDADLPEYKTNGGVHRCSDGVTVTAPVSMWLASLDLLLNRMQEKKVNFSKIFSISGAGQQHGSVYWKNGAVEKLRKLNPDVPLKENLLDCFSLSDSPIWMDSSTETQCRKLENEVGGPMELCKLTGSRSYHRFTGNQILKIYQNNPSVYANTERISLVSSFACSLFIGDYAPIDFADASGMNLFNINEKRFEPALLETCGGKDLAQKLGVPVPSCSIVGNIAQFFVNKYNFSPDCSIVAFTGDNPASLAGMNLQPNDIAISLGTSDTVIVWLKSWTPSLNAHVFCNPLDSSAFMGLLCYKNGSLTRERIREKCKCNSWLEFDSLLLVTPPGNGGNIGFYFDMPEILPEVKAGDHRFNRKGDKVSTFSPEVEVRAVIEHQCLTKRLYTETLAAVLEDGQKNVFSGKVLVTGGASNNKTIAQVISNVFQRKVYAQQDFPHSSALGSAYRAKHGLSTERSFNEVCSELVDQFVLIAEPDTTTAQRTMEK